MATEVIETETELGYNVDVTSNMDLNKGNPESDTPRLFENLENGPTETLTSEEEEPDVLRKRTEPLSESAGDALLQSTTKTGDPQHETALDNGENPEETRVRSSSPVRPSPPSSPLEDSGSLGCQESVDTAEASLSLEGVELKEEWQDEDFPRPLPEEEEEDLQLEEELFIGAPIEGNPGTPSYGLNGDSKAKKKLEAPDISLTLDRTGSSVLTNELEESTEMDLEDIDTPSDNSNEFDWEDDLPKPKATELLQQGVESVQELSAAEEREEGRRWRVFRLGEQEHRVDMKAIEPYKRVISHGGYYGDGLNALIVFAVCFMPESNQPNYRYIMDNLFKYVIGTLELLVAENYMIVYLNGATSRKRMPSVGWLRKCYQQIDRRLRKNLKALIIVHPSWFIRTVLAITRPFISTKFSQKIKYVFNLTDLAELVPMEYVSIPECIKQYDEEKNRKKRKRIDRDMCGKVEIATAAVPQ